MVTNKFTGKFGIAVIMVAIFIIFGVILSFNHQGPTIEDQENPENKTSGDKELSPLEKEMIEDVKKIEDFAKKENITATYSHLSTIDGVSMTSEPKFVVGEKYTYFIRWPQPMDFNQPGMHPPNLIFNDYMYTNITLSVDKKEKINRTDCYKISTEGSGPVIAGYATYNDEKGTRPITRILVEPFTDYISTKTGDSIDPQTGEIKREHFLEYYDIFMYWMLRLSDGAKWTNLYEEKDTGYVTCADGICKAIKEESELKEKKEYEVKGIEIVNKRKCFRVESRVLSQKNNGVWEVTHKTIHWVDVEKRITVKYQLWYQNLQTVEIELIEYEK